MNHAEITIPASPVLRERLASNLRERRELQAFLKLAELREREDARRGQFNTKVVAGRVGGSSDAR